MELIANATFRIYPDGQQARGFVAGIYRIIVDDIRQDLTVIVFIHPDMPETRARGGRKQKPDSELKRPRKKKQLPNVGALIWAKRSDLLALTEARELAPIQVVRTHAPLPLKDSDSRLATRIALMEDFLDARKLYEGIVTHHGLGGLVAEASKRHGKSTALIYKLWSHMCRWGLDERSLLPRLDRCGAPGIRRPCNPPKEGLPARRKAGRKTKDQHIAAQYGIALAPGQPGMTEEWAAAIRAADARIPVPKPSWTDRCTRIIKSAFCGRVKETDGKIEYVQPSFGECPNSDQIKRVLTEGKTHLDRIRERTTKRHFDSALRGLKARNWRDVSGPGHTWAIDSTVGDIYLRSSVNLQWIIGRPIVYVIVDVWSTAIVGFYVCLTGPSWNTAKVALFNSGADPNLIGELWGYQPVLCLNPLPSLPYALLCDRGEFLSQAHRCTAFKLLPLTSYTPPYRGDLKGLVEVLHRIEKDAQFMFIPGAMDHRRKEMEMRRADPSKAVFTVRTYVQYLQELFTTYNLTADRSHRVDAHMQAAGVYPSPAGLWRYGHEVGIGYRRYVPSDDLVVDLLPRGVGRVRRDAVSYGGCDYSSPEVEQAQWASVARNVGGWDIPITHYPGSVSTIWTQPEAGSELWRLTLSDQSRSDPTLTMDELADTLALQTANRPRVEFERQMARVEGLKRMTAMRDAASKRVAEALAKAQRGAQPTMTEARAMELTATTEPSGSATKAIETTQAEGMDAHEAMMEALLSGD